MIYRTPWHLVCSGRLPPYCAASGGPCPTFHTQVAQTAACNNHHPVDARLARWLLMAHDRAERDEFPMTHEFMSLMLGTRRPSISVAAAVLQKAGAIGYTHGRMRVLDRAGLEAASCECYGTVREQFEYLLGVPAGE